MPTPKLSRRELEAQARGRTVNLGQTLATLVERDRWIRTMAAHCLPLELAPQAYSMPLGDAQKHVEAFIFRRERRAKPRGSE